MAHKMNKKARATLNRTCLIVAAVLAVPTYALVPFDGRGPIALATVAAGGIGYGITRYLITRAYAAAMRPAPRAAK